MTPQAMPTPQQLEQLLAAPSREDVWRLFKSSHLHFKVDIETASTVAGDQQQRREEHAQHMQSSGAYWTGMLPMIERGLIDSATALDVWAANSRGYNLGRAAEDAIDHLSRKARQNTGQPKPPSPEQQQQQVKLQAEQFKLQAAREEHGWTMREKMADARIRLVEKGIASRPGSDGQEEFVSAEDVRLEQNHAALARIAAQQTQMASQTAATVNQLAGTVAQLAQGMQQLRHEQRATAVAQAPISEFEVVRDPKTGRMTGAKVVR